MAVTAQPRLSKPKRRALPPHYSRVVGILKVLLPSIAAVLLGLVVAWPQLASRDDRFQLGFSNLDPKQVDTLSMLNARYFGTDETNRPFSVTADVATQADPNAVIVSLEAPKADMSLKDGSGIVMNSDVGYYRQKDQLLDLMGGVDVYHEGGYELHTTSARVDLAQGAAAGDDPVSGQGPFGRIEGQGFSLSDRGKTIIFTGKSKLVLTATKKKGKK